MAGMTPNNRTELDRALVADRRVPLEHRLALLDLGVPGDPTTLLRSVLAGEPDAQTHPLLARRIPSDTTRDPAAVAHRLLDAGAQPFSYPWSALDEAMRIRWPTVVTRLLRHPAAPPYEELVAKRVRAIGTTHGKSREAVSMSWLNAAAAWDDVELAEVLLERGFDPNSRDDEGTPALFEASSESMQTLFLQSGATLHAKDAKQRTVFEAWRLAGCSGAERNLTAVLRRTPPYPNTEDAHRQGLFDATSEKNEAQWILHFEALQSVPEHLSGPGTFPKAPPLPQGCSESNWSPLGLAARSLLRSPKIDLDFWNTLIDRAPDAWLLRMHPTKTGDGVYEGALVSLVLAERQGRKPADADLKRTRTQWEQRWQSVLNGSDVVCTLVDASLAIHRRRDRADTRGPTDWLNRAWKAVWDGWRTAPDALRFLQDHESDLTRLFRESHPTVHRAFLEAHPWFEFGTLREGTDSEGAFHLRFWATLSQTQIPPSEAVGRLLLVGARWDFNHPLAAAARQEWGDRCPPLTDHWRADDARTSLEAVLPDQSVRRKIRM